MKITCFIRYQIDPFQRDDFKKYAENWVVSFLDEEATWSDIFFRMKARTTWLGV